MDRDPKNDNKKCGGPGSPNRTFKLNGKNAQKKKCLEKCLKDKNCVAMSGEWNKWCIGCKKGLNVPHRGAIAYEKDF